MMLQREWRIGCRARYCLSELQSSPPRIGGFQSGLSVTPGAFAGCVMLGGTMPKTAPVHRPDLPSGGFLSRLEHRSTALLMANLTAGGGALLGSGKPRYWIGGERSVFTFNTVSVITLVVSIAPWLRRAYSVSSRWILCPSFNK
jgi:hypothetical protein